MTNKTEWEGHTPLPWAIYRQTIETREDAKAELAELIDGTKRIGDELPLLVGADDLCPATTGCGRAAKANAALIVHCVNNFPALEAEKDALREALLTARSLLPERVCERHGITQALAISEKSE